MRGVNSPPNLRLSRHNRRNAGYLSLELVLVVAGGGLLATLAALAVFGMAERAQTQRNASFAGHQISIFDMEAQAVGRAQAILNLTNATVALPSGEFGVLGSACAFDSSDAPFIGTLDAEADVVTCGFCTTNTAVPTEIALASCITGGGLPLRCASRGSQRVAAQNAPETPLGTPPAASEALFGLWMPADDMAEAAELEHHINSYLVRSGAGGFTRGINALNNEEYTPGLLRSGALFSRVEVAGGTAGVLLCL